MITFSNQSNMPAASIWGPTKYCYRWRIDAGRYNITIEQRKSCNVMGRFGGGWNWHVGAEWGKSSTILFLFVMSIRFSNFQHKAVS